MLITLLCCRTGAQRPALPAAGENKARKRKTAEAQKELKKRAASQPSGARFVGWLAVAPDSLTVLSLLA